MCVCSVQAFAPGACVLRVTLLVLLLLAARGLTPASMTAWLPSWPCRVVWLGPTWPLRGCRDSAWQWRQSCAWSQVRAGLMLLCVQGAQAAVMRLVKCTTLITGSSVGVWCNQIHRAAGSQPLCESAVTYGVTRPIHLMLVRCGHKDVCLLCGICAAGQWRRACVCCEALMRGCNDRAALSSSEAYAHSRGGEAPAAPSTAGDTLLTSLGVTAPLATPGQLAAASAAAGSSAAEPEPPVQKQQQQMWGIMGFGGLFIDNYQLAPDATDTQVGGRQPVWLATGYPGAAAPTTMQSKSSTCQVGSNMFVAPAFIS